MERKGRNELKEIFSRGSLPTELHFRTLIDSILNLEDDDFQSLLDGPLKIYSKNDKENPGTKKTVLEFYSELEDTVEKPVWRLLLDKDEEGQDCLQLVNQQDTEVLHISPSGKVRIKSSLTSIAGSTYLSQLYGNITSNLPADGNWHPLLPEVTGCQSYEVIACVGNKNDPNSQFAITKATAMAVPSKVRIWDFLFPERNKVHMVQNYTGSSRNKIDLRWKKTSSNSHRLEIRTRCNYPGELNIRCRIIKTFADEFMVENIAH